MFKNKNQKIVNKDENEREHKEIVKLSAQQPIDTTVAFYYAKS